MDDLTSKVQEILGSEDGMRQLQEMAQMLGLSGSTENSSAPSGNQPDLSAALSGLMGSDDQAGLSAADLVKISGMMQNIREETPSTALLKALRPLLRQERQKKVDEALRIMRLLSLWPVLQQSGLLKGFLGDSDPNV